MKAGHSIARLKFNGVNQGLYFMEESLGKELLEKNGMSGHDVVKSMDELTVPNASYPAGSIDPGNPEASILTFFNATVAKSENAGANQSLFDRSQHIAAATTITLGSFK